MKAALAIAGALSLGLVLISFEYHAICWLAPPGLCRW